jgi:hypothetical protein
MKSSESTSSWKHRLIYCLIALGACAGTITLFYAEEDLRGWKAMQAGKAQLAAEGIDLNWKKQIPAPVPKEDNVFGIPEMQRWFEGHGGNDLSRRLMYQGPENPKRLIVAQLTIGLTGASAPSGTTAFQTPDSEERIEFDRLVSKEFGPRAGDPGAEFFFTKQASDGIQPLQIFLQCKAMPSDKEVKNYVPDLSGFASGVYIHPKIEKIAEGHYDVTIDTPPTAAEYLTWMKQFDPAMALIRQALERPYARMEGDYSQPANIPIPNFVMIRSFSQRLSSSAKCHLLLGQPDEALRDLQLIDKVCQRVLEDNKPMTLVSAMINVAVQGLVVDTISSGIQMQAWQEPQLVALQNQLSRLNLFPPVKTALESEKRSLCLYLSTLMPGELTKLYQTFSSKTQTLAEKRDAALFQMIPRGWFWQNMATVASLPFAGGIDTVNQLVNPAKVQSAGNKLHKTLAHWSPYSFMCAWAVPNFNRAFQTTALNQTLVNQAIVVCALEHFRLAHGQYPETLDMLVPQYVQEIPHNVIGGEPPHYHKTGDTFLLYSIGWDEHDHGGMADADTSKPGDWVWPEK